jgi:hypothetical protein
MHRERKAHQVVYAGWLGVAAAMGCGDALVYALGGAPVSGLGSLCLDRAFADIAWLKERLTRLEAGERMGRRWTRLGPLS